jgi:hypothetical protein
LRGGKAVDPTPGRWKQWPGNVKLQSSPFKIHNISVIKGDWETMKKKNIGGEPFSGPQQMSIRK